MKAAKLLSKIKSTGYYNSALVLLALCSLALLVMVDLPGMWPDEAVNGLDALDVAEGKRSLSVFYTANNGREGLHVALLAAAFKVFGASITTLRAVSVVGGLLTVAALAALARELSIRLRHSARARRHFVLVTIVVGASSHWLAYFSQIGFRAIWGVFLLTFAAATLLAAERKDRLWLWAVSGGLFGLSFYSYLAVRVTAPLLALALLVLFVGAKAFTGKRTQIICFLACGALVVLPLAIYFAQNPDLFSARTGQVSVFTSSNPLLNFVKSAVALVSMLIFRGDGNIRHNFYSVPQVAFTLVPLLGVGLFSFKAGILSKDRRVYILLGAWMFAGMLPALLSDPGENPHALRAILSLSPVLMFVVVGYEQARVVLTSKVGITKSRFVLMALLVGAVAQLLFMVARLPADEQIQGSFLSTNVNAAELAANQLDAGKPGVVRTQNALNGFELHSVDFVLRARGYDLDSVTFEDHSQFTDQ